MTRHILISLSLVAFLAFAPSLQNEASARIELSEIDNQDNISIDQQGNTLIIKGGANKVLHVFNIIGVEVLTIKIDTNYKTVDLSSLKRSMYPIKIGKLSRKLTIGAGK